jgi:hypothetical protein
MANAFSSASIMQNGQLNSGVHSLRSIFYTLQIAPPAFYAFIIVGCMLIAWCLPLLLWCSTKKLPNSTIFPEIDFAARMKENVLRQMEGMSNTTSTKIVQGIRNKEIYAGKEKKVSRHRQKVPA